MSDVGKTLGPQGALGAVGNGVGGLIGGGGIGGGVGSILGGAGSGVNSILSPFGLGGEQGAYYQPSAMPELQNTNGALDQMNTNQNQVDTGEFQARLQNVAAGHSTPMELMRGAPLTQAQQNQLSTGSTTGSQFATEAVQNNPILGQLYGKGGEMEKNLGYEDAQKGIADQLQNQGYKLQPQDLEAYGQASGDIARLFGHQGNQVSQDLAMRGLSSAPSGAAGAQFSGLAGNKNEMLAKAQTDIANARMQNTQQRLAQQQNFINNIQSGNRAMGQQAGGAIQDQYGRQLSGAQNYQNNLQNTATAQQNANNAQNAAAMDQWKAQNEASQQSLTDKRNAAGKTLFGAIGKGLYGGTESGVSGATSKGIGMAASGLMG